MRKLGQELGVEAMALYRHVRNKDDILDGAIDVVVGEIELPGPKTTGGPRCGLALAARQVMLRHPWAPPVIVERPEIGPATLRHINAVMEILRGAGFSLELSHHAIHVLGSRMLGFTQDPFDDSADTRPDPETAARVARELGEQLSVPRRAGGSREPRGRTRRLRRRFRVRVRARPDPRGPRTPARDCLTARPSPARGLPRACTPLPRRLRPRRASC